MYGQGPHAVQARAPPGHTRLHHSSDPSVGPGARLRDRANDSREFRGYAAGRNRFTVSGTPPPRQEEMDRRRLGDVGERPERARLYVDGRRTQTTRRRALEVGAAHPSDRRPDAAARGDRSMRLPWTGRRDAADRALDEEIRAHLAMAVADRIARGESPDAALATARREFGNVGHVKEITREAWGGVWLD